MQDAHPNCRSRVFGLILILATGLVCLPAQSAELALTSLTADPSSGLVVSDALGDGGLEGGAPRCSVPPRSAGAKTSDPMPLGGYRGPVSSASFPVLPQAPPRS